MEDDLFVVTDIIMFVCTLETRLSNMEFNKFDDFATRICTFSDHPHFVAINSNFGHYCRPGYEKFLKTKKIKKNADANAPDRASQGDGSCFNSAIEPILTIDPLVVGTIPKKVYKIKFFPSTGRIQIPGIKLYDFSDGHTIMRVMLNYIKQELHNKFSTNLLSYPVIMLKNPPPPKPKRKKQKKEVAEVEIIYPEGEYTVSAEPAKKITPELIDEITYSEIKPILIDTKFQFKIDPKNIIVVSNLFNILSIDVDSTEDQIVEAQINNETVHITIKPDEIIKPRRGRITTLNRMTEGKIAFFLSIDNIKPNVLFFQSGKVNILGSKAHEVTSIIYDYLHSIMEIYQEFIIVGRQLPDDL
jgi:hypothetical protein